MKEANNLALCYEKNDMTVRVTWAMSRLFSHMQMQLFLYAFCTY